MYVCICVNVALTTNYMSNIDKLPIASSTKYTSSRAYI